MQNYNIRYMIDITSCIESIEKQQSGLDILWEAGVLFDSLHS